MKREVQSFDWRPGRAGSPPKLNQINAAKMEAASYCGGEKKDASFAGLPPPMPGVAADVDDQHHTFEALAVSLDEVKPNFHRWSGTPLNPVIYYGKLCRS